MPTPTTYYAIPKPARGETDYEDEWITGADNIDAELHALRVAVDAFTAAGAGSGVALQGTTPGTTQTGHWHISGTGVADTAIETPTIVGVGLGLFFDPR